MDRYSAKRRFLKIALCLGLLLLLACAPTRTWRSLPAVQHLETPEFDLSFEPVKGKKNAYSAFRLTVVNKTGADLKIDWNRSRYLMNGKNAGHFVFRGVSPEQIKEGTIADDLVAAGSRFTKIIAPIGLIAFAPMARKGVGIATEGISAGVLPEGDSGISLVLSLPDGQIRREMTVRIEAVSGQPSSP